MEDIIIALAYIFSVGLGTG